MKWKRCLRPVSFVLLLILLALRRMELRLLLSGSENLEHIPERAAVGDPESKPSQAAAGEPLTEAGNSSEANARLPLGGQGKGKPQTPRLDSSERRATHTENDQWHPI
jgi:hypothetical protein